MKADLAKARFEETKKHFTKFEEETLRKLFHATMQRDLAKARSEAIKKHLTTKSESPPPTVLQAAKASLRNQLEAAEKPSPEIEAQMWRDHAFLRDRRIAVLLSVTLRAPASRPGQHYEYTSSRNHDFGHHY